MEQTTQPSNDAAAGAGDRPAVVLTEKAQAEVARLLEKEGLGGTHFLRVKVVGGGCSGMSYQLAFDDKPLDEDLSYPIAGGFEVRVDPGARQYLHGTIIDYLDNFGGGGFSFRNPNAASTCGCGTSFSV